MNVLFLTMSGIDSINSAGIYTDLMREFVKHDHRVFIVSPTEKRNNERTTLIDEGNCKILRVRTGNLQKTNLIEKGVSTLKITGQFIRAIKKYFKNERFDLVLYTTPPITLDKVVKFVKKRDNAFTYLLLKDIFPQNAIDIGVLRKSGLKGLIYKYFRKKEKRLYAISDKIGCMSRANVEFVIKNNPEVDEAKLSIIPNSIEPQDVSLTAEEKVSMRQKYDLPLDKTVFVYGGNLGRPQGIPFIIECLRSQAHNDRAFFLIVGDGTEYGKLEMYISSEKPQNVRLMKRLPREVFDKMLAACDVGMIFLDHRFTIPNYPSRLLSYMQAGLPVISCTDKNTDVGQDIVDSGIGWSCSSDDVDAFEHIMQQIANTDLGAMGILSRQTLTEKFSVEKGYRDIMTDIPSDNLRS